ncbi:oxidoreductase FAD-binding region [Pseudomonas aeruginosa]|nr:oxidoreductase FAD-binding region [Pseudomonas aeruginosa]
MSLPIPFLETVERLIPRERRFDRPAVDPGLRPPTPVSTGLIPKLVLRVESEDEVAAILSAAYREQVPVTFRAAGTSLSGQAISDSVLLVLGDKLERPGNPRRRRADPPAAGCHRRPGERLAGAVRPQDRSRPGLDQTPARSAASSPTTPAACAAAPRRTATTPLPACACCWPTAPAWTARTRPASRPSRASHGELLERLAELGRGDPAPMAELAAKIRHKYRLKNTTGLSLNALVDYDEPLDILTHLMVGSRAPSASSAR